MLNFSILMLHLLVSGGYFNMARVVYCGWTSKCPYGCDCRNDKTVIASGKYFKEIPVLPYTTMTLRFTNSGCRSRISNTMLMNKNCEHLTLLDLSDNNIQHIEAASFAHIPFLKSLLLANNRLQKLETNIFQNLNHLSALDLSHNSFSLVPVTVLCSIPTIENITIGNNPFIDLTLGNDCLRGLNKLHSISFVGTNLKYILQGDSFVGLRTLNILHLDFEHCHISRLPETLFRSTPFLEELNLRSNDISVLSGESLSYLPNLAVVDLMFNKFSTWHFTAITKSVKLKSLQFSSVMNMVYGNDLKHLSSMPLLENLTLERGEIDSISWDYFSCFNASYNLKHISFQIFQFHDIARGAFQWFPAITHFKLSSSALNKICYSDVLFNLSKSVVEIDLSGNKNFQIQTDTFSVLQNPENIKFLDLSSNALGGSIPITLLMPLRNLEVLLLSGNYLRQIEYHPDSVVFPTMRQLLLNDNCIKDPGLGIFHTFPNLRHLDLSANTMNKFSVPLKRNNSNQIEKLYLIKCGLNKLTNMYQFSGLTHLYVSANRLTILKEETFLGLKKLQFLSLEYNSLHYLNANLFQDQINMNTLLLNSNNIQYIHYSALLNLQQLTDLKISNNGITIINMTSIRNLTSLNFIDIANNPLTCSCDALPFNQWLQRKSVYIHGLMNPGNLMCKRDSKDIDFVDCRFTNRECQHISEIIIILCVYLCVCVAFVLIALVYRHRWYIRYECFLLRTKVYRYRETQQQNPYLFDAFVSFSNHDYEWVMNKLVEQVEVKNNLKLCLYDRNWLGGRRVVDYIISSIDGSKSVVLIVTNRWAQSTWCSDEMYLARFVRWINLFMK